MREWDLFIFGFVLVDQHPSPNLMMNVRALRLVPYITAPIEILIFYLGLLLYVPRSHFLCHRDEIDDDKEVGIPRP